MLWSLDHSLAQMIIVMYCWMCLIIFESRVLYVHTLSYRIKTHHFIKSVNVFVFPGSSGPWPDHPEPCAQMTLEHARWSIPTPDHPNLGVRLYIGPRLSPSLSSFFLPPSPPIASSTPRAAISRFDRGFSLQVDSLDSPRFGDSVPLHLSSGTSRFARETQR